MDSVGKNNEKTNKKRGILTLVGFGFLLTLIQWFGLLPEALHRLPEWLVPPLQIWLDAIFNFVKDDLHLLDFTRMLTQGLQWLLDSTANLLFGKRRWPHMGPIPWMSIAAVAGIIGYYLGGWRLAALGAGTFIWTAMIGQWKIAMETMSVLIVAAPVAFIIGLLLGIWAWKSRTVEAALQPILSILQTIPFFTYLLPAVIFFKVGPTAGAVATIVYAIPPMILMTTLGLKKVSHEVVEAGKMSGCSSWQMLRYVYIPSARTEILVGVNQVIMLCLAMVVLTAFIGMPGLGAKLLAMMGSFKLGRSMEIGITIVLLAVMLDRLTKAWVAKQPEHFEKSTSWFLRHKYLVMSVAAFVFFIIVAQFWDFASEVGRKQHYSQGKALDGFVKNTLLQDPTLKFITTGLRVFMNNYVLIPFRNFLLSIPMPAFIAFVVALSWYMAGRKQALFALAFFSWVALSGWWDRSIITIYYVVSSTAVAALIAIPLAVWGASPPAQRIDFSKGINGDVIIGLISLIFRRSIIAFASFIVAGILRYMLWKLGVFGDEEVSMSIYRLVYWIIFAISFYLIWRFMGQMMRDVFLLLAADSAQTFPSFVYLLPAIMLFSITPIAVLFAIMIFAMVPLLRYTIEGLRNVPAEMTESADMSGATRMQKLWTVQFPLALPTMAVGFNQALMFAFFMTMIAAYIGTVDLGQELQRTLAGTDLGKNFVLGFNVAFMALTFDMIILHWSNTKKKLLGLQE
ncbi:MAG: ABC transporter permease subunit [Paracoccaceae bacterium]|nr:ABC transporter permease subunit [Paracoccaceae bacterium]